jgi:hypothetical protein
MKCPACDRKLDISVTRSLVRCQCGADLVSNGRALMSVVVSAWFVATVAAFLSMRFLTNQAWIWFFGGDIVFLIVVYFLAMRFWRVKVVPR